MSLIKNPLLKSDYTHSRRIGRQESPVTVLAEGKYKENRSKLSKLAHEDKVKRLQMTRERLRGF